MKYLIISFQIIFPVLVYMGIGMFIRRIKLIDENAFSQINKLAFRVFLPIKLFLDIYHSDFKQAFQPKIILFVLASIFIAYGITWYIIGKRVEDRKDAPTIIQAVYRSNYVLFGMSIAAGMYPDEDLGVVSVMAAFVVPAFNILAVVLFEIWRGGKAISLLHLLKGVATNGLVVGSAAGLLFLGLKIQMPQLIMKPMTALGDIATPLAIVCVGATLTFAALKRYAGYIAVMAAGRLVVIPGIFVTAAIAFGFRGMELAGLFLVFASPTATASYPMAKELGGNGELAGLGVAVSNVASLFTIFFWIVILKYFQLC